MTAVQRQEILTLLSRLETRLTAIAQATIKKDLRTGRHLKGLADQVNSIRVEIYEMTDGDLG